MERKFYVYHTGPEHWPSFLSLEENTSRFTSRHRNRALNINNKDVFICYLQGSKSLCGALEVSGDHFIDPSDKEYPIHIPIRPIVMLELIDAVSVKEKEVWKILCRGRDIAQNSSGWIAKIGLRGDLWTIKDPVGPNILEYLEDFQDKIYTKIEEFDPNNAKFDRQTIVQNVKDRRGQPAFRDSLLSAYENKCAITDSTVSALLEAAHIYPHVGLTTHNITNGLLLRADIHTLFDCGLIGINPDNYKIKLSKILENSEYDYLNEKTIRLPKNYNCYPSKKSLIYHFSNIFKK